MLNLGTIGAVAVAIGGDTSGLKKSLGEADQALAKTEQRMEAAKKVGVALGLALVATAAAMGAMIKRATDYADKTGKLAQQTGVATRTLSEMTYVAKLAGVSQDGMASSMGRLNRNIVDAAAGTGDALRAFEALNINVKNADGTLKSADQVMAEVADKFAGMEDGANKSGIAMMLMGRSGAQMIPMLNGGSQAIQALRNEAVLFGNVVDDKTAKAAEAFNDNLSRMGEVLNGIGMRMASAVLPVLERMSGQLVQTAKDTEGLARAGEVASTGLKLLMTAGTIVTSIFSTVGKTLGGFAAMVVQLLSGEFRQALNTSQNIFTDWQKGVRDAVRSVEDTWSDASGRVGSIKFGPSGSGGAKGSGTRVKSTEEINAAKAARQKELEEAEKHRIAVLQVEIDAATQAKQVEHAKWEEKQRIITEGLERIEDSFKTEQERQVERYEEELELLRLALEEKNITQEEFDGIAEQLATRHEEKLTAIHNKGLTDREKFSRMSMKDQVKTVFGELANITSGVAQHNKKLFELNKMAGIATAIIKAYEGISRTLGAYPFPINVAMAAAHGLAAFAQVQAIRGTSFSGGGGAAPALAGGTPAPPVTPVGGGAGGGQESQRSMTIILPGTEFTSTKAVRQLLVPMAEELNSNGSRVTIK